MTCHYVEDPLEAALIGCHVTGSHSGEKEECVRLLNSYTAYTHRQFPKEVLCVEEPTPKEQEKSMPKAELKALPSHLRYCSLTLITSSLLSSVLNWIAHNWKNCRMCSKSIRVPLVMVLMILRDSILNFVCIASFLMKVIDPADNLSAV